jgi:hypothetical protein
MKHLMMIGCCTVVSLCVLAQEGAPAGAPRKTDSAPAAKPEPVDPAVEAWIQVLAKKIADAQPLVRDSSVAALERIGKPALSHLNTLTSSTDKAVADAAKKLVERINRGPQPGQGRGPGQWGAERVDSLVKDLGLDDKKAQKLRDLHKVATDRAREGFEAVQAGDLTREEFREEMRQHREEMQKELRKFLSEDEAKKVEESLGQGMGGGRRPGGGEGGGVRRRPPPGGGQDR